MSKNELILSTLALFEANYGAKLNPVYRAFLVRKLDAIPEDVITAVFDEVISKYSRTAADEEYRLYAQYPDWAIIKAEIDKLYHIPTDSERKALKAEAAWNSLLQAIEFIGSWKSPSCLDETTLYCIRSFGGWERVCSWRESELTWRKKEFLEVFNQADGRVSDLLGGVSAIEAVEGRKGKALPTGSFVGNYLAGLAETQATGLLQ